MDKRIWFGLYQFSGNIWSVGCVLCCGGVSGEWVGGLDKGLEGWGGVMSV